MQTDGAASRPRIFFGYPYQPNSRREAMVNASLAIQRTAVVDTKTWEQLAVSGRFVIHEILREIDDSRAAAFDVTTLNSNVMFELGYAIGAQRVVWLLRDESDEPSSRLWSKVKVLTTVGYDPFTNSEHIVKAFWKNRPDVSDKTIFATAIEETLVPSTGSQLFYIKSPHETEAARKLSKRVLDESSRGIKILVADPDEMAVESLAWYAQQIYASDAVIAHFSSPNRFGADVHNVRAALVCGLAVGMKKPVLMLSEEDYTSPVDYRDLVKVYLNAEQCVSHADAWLTQKLAQAYQRVTQIQEEDMAWRLSVELKSLRLGEPVAENEASQLENYFIETASFNEILDKETVVFIGRKGTGKTANMISAAERLRADKRHLVCQIKPAVYELEGVVSLMKKVSERSERSYLIESLWRFLLLSEIANAAYIELSRSQAGPEIGSAEDQFMVFMDGDGRFLKQDFAVRLESAVDSLQAVGSSASIQSQRESVSEALHAGILQTLRQHLGQVLNHKTRVAVLVDNLDKVWRRDSDIAEMSNFLLGLLSSIGRIAKEFSRKDHWREPVRVTLAVFVRSDIFAHIQRVAREPDKIPTTRILWRDPGLLRRVIEERYLASRGGKANPGELWERYFCQDVRGSRPAEYILSRILPRPRDFILFCSGAIAHAVNRRSTIVEEVDVLEAENVYSQFAFEALLVENGISLSELESVLYEFAGQTEVLTEQDARQAISRVGLGDRAEDVIRHLRALSFLGIEIEESEYAFEFDLEETTRSDALARGFAARTGRRPRLKIHPAFHKFLGVRE